MDGGDRLGCVFKKWNGLAACESRRASEGNGRLERAERVGPTRQYVHMGWWKVSAVDVTAVSVVGLVHYVRLVLILGCSFPLGQIFSTATDTKLYINLL